MRLQYPAGSSRITVPHAGQRGLRELVHRASGETEVMKTKEQALRDLGRVVAEAAAIVRTLAAREAAERAWRPGGPSVDDLTVSIREAGLCRDDDSCPPRWPLACAYEAIISRRMRGDSRDPRARWLWVA